MMKLEHQAEEIEIDDFCGKLYIKKAMRKLGKGLTHLNPWLSAAFHGQQLRPRQIDNAFERLN